MMKKIFISVILFYLLFIFQTSFLAHFSVKGFIINFILITVFILNILEAPEKNDGIIGAGILGFFWDFSSEKFIGFHLLILISIAILIKLVFRRYVRIQIVQRT